MFTEKEQKQFEDVIEGLSNTSKELAEVFKTFSNATEEKESVKGDKGVILDEYGPTVYIGAPISDLGQIAFVNMVANDLRFLGYKVYSAIEDESINNKENNPSPVDIYCNDIKGIEQSDIFVYVDSGGLQVGTNVELGYVLGRVESGSDIEVIAFTHNKRLQNPQIEHGLPSASTNHLALGGILRQGDYLESYEAFFAHMADEAYNMGLIDYQRWYTCEAGVSQLLGGCANE